MKRLVIGAIGLLALCGGAGCQQKEKPAVDHAQVDALYRDLRRQYIVYADSLRHVAPDDSAGTRAALIARFEAGMNAIYRRYPADLDEHLSPNQNDTLWHYASLYNEARTHRPAPADSIPTDSIPTDSI